MTRPLRILLASFISAATVLVGLASPASAASGWTSLSSGDGHTCGIRSGRIYCWGKDQSGQLGDGAADAGRSVPAPIASGATDWTSVSAGAFHTCATRVGRVACWGDDSLGQLGDGAASIPNTPDPSPGFIASGATDWTSVSAGSNHTCAIRAGRVACWGSDGHGQLGDGTTGPGGPDTTPGIIASGATDWTSVSAGSSHTCAIRAGRVACWGNDEWGQLGDGTAGVNRATPALIASGATDWTAVSVGLFHTCAIRAGRVACWGYDFNGQLGDGTVNNTADPSPGLIASGATDWTSVTAGVSHTCATRIGRVACWGYDYYGQLGDGTAGGSDPLPGFISSGATDWKRVDTGSQHTCAIRATLLACWGYDAYGQLGDGTAGDTPDPIPNLETS